MSVEGSILLGKVSKQLIKFNALAHKKSINIK